MTGPQCEGIDVGNALGCGTMNLTENKLACHVALQKSTCDLNKDQSNRCLYATYFVPAAIWWVLSERTALKE
jgi:hypothetical protein